MPPNGGESVQITRNSGDAPQSATVDVRWAVLVCSTLPAAAQGVMAMTRRGLPEPPTIFRGAAMTMAPVGGSSIEVGQTSQPELAAAVHQIVVREGWFKGGGLTGIGPDRFHANA